MTVYRDYTFEVTIIHACFITTISSNISLTDLDVLVGPGNGYSQQFVLSNSAAESYLPIDNAYCGSYSCGSTVSSATSYLSTALSIDSSSTVDEVMNFALSDAIPADVGTYGVSVTCSLISYPQSIYTGLTEFSSSFDVNVHEYQIIFDDHHAFIDGTVFSFSGEFVDVFDSLGVSYLNKVLEPSAMTFEPTLDVSLA